ncbi:MAG: hypothetical protein CMK36_09460 [Porticoccaceae bacterium]|nr:hypothetical protein [Porticoccaceae bacterium]
MEEKHSFRLYLIEASAGFLAFLIILAAIERSGAFDFHFREHAGKHRWIEFYETALKDEIDALIVGNSQSLAAVDCELLSTHLNKNFFAIGHDAAKISSLYWSVRHALNYTSPSVICLETKCFGFFNGLYEFERAIQSRRDLGFRKTDPSVLEATVELHGIYSIPFTLFGSSLSFPEILETDPILTIKSIEKWRKSIQSKKTKLGSYNNYKESIDDALLARYKSGESGRDYIDALPSKQDIEDMERLILLCERKGIRLFFFETPYFQADQKNIENRQTKLQSFFNSQGQDWKTFWQNQKLISNPDFYQNSLYNQHLTGKGAQAFTLQLAKVLKDRQLFSDNQ